MHLQYKMQGNAELGSLPEGINLLKCGNTGDTYVVNELLNFYQRKLRILGKSVAVNLAHHIFEVDDFVYAVKVLADLWEWKKLSPSTSNDYVIRNLQGRRRIGACRTKAANDIINFFEAEDANLNIRFLTLECEKIPSPIHESEAMKDVYVLLHKSQADYNCVMEHNNVRDDRISAHEDMLETLRKEMKEGFKAVSDIIKDSMPSKVSRQTEELSVSLQNNAVNTELSPPVVIGHIASVEEDVSINENRDLEENKNANETEECQVEEDELEEGELRESSNDEIKSPNDAIVQQISQYRHMHQMNQQQQQQLQRHQQRQRQHQQQQQEYRTPPNDMSWNDILRASRPGHLKTQIPPRGQTPPPREQNTQRTLQNTGNSTISGSSQQNTPFLKKKQRRNIILDEDDGSIPFSATKDLFKYEMFVTSISRDSKVEDIKSHLITKLGTDDISIKPMSKYTASYLSFGVFCRSEKKDLDLKMPGLWPKGTRIYKWNSKAGDTRITNRVHSSQSQERSRGSNGGRGSYYRQDYHGNDVQRNDYKDNYRYRYPDQQRLNNQYNG